MGGLVSSAIDLVTGHVGGGAAPAAPLPKVEPTPEMPTPDDAAVKAEKRKSIAKQRARRGRASTIFSEDEPLGG